MDQGKLNALLQDKAKQIFVCKISSVNGIDWAIAKFVVVARKRVQKLIIGLKKINGSRDRLADLIERIARL